MTEKRVIVTMTGSYGYLEPGVDQRKYYGPGVNIPVPIGLARGLGLPFEDPEAEAIKNVEEQRFPDLPEAEEAEMIPDWPVELEEEPVPLIDYRRLDTTWPGYMALFEAGYTTVDHLLGLTKRDLTDIPGIGKATADKILKRLANE